MALRPDQVAPLPRRHERVVVPVSGLNRAVIQAVNVGRSVSSDIRAVLVAEDPAYAEEVRTAWERQVPGVPLVVVESPYRALTGPLLAYLEVLDQTWPPDKETPVTFVVIPEFVPRHWWERLLYNQSTQRAAAGPARPARHGRHERPVPARGARGLPAAGRWSGRRTTDRAAAGLSAAVLSCAAGSSAVTPTRRGSQP